MANSQRDYYFDKWVAFKARYQSILEELSRESSESRSPGPSFLFRGQRDADWGLETSLEVLINKRLEADYGRHEGVLKAALRRFQQDILADPDFRHAGVRREDDPEPWVPQLARHYEAPADFTDWTESPYVAAFFAFSALLTQTPLEAVRGSTFVGVWAVKNAKRWQDKKYIVEGDPMAGSNPRLTGQKGWFFRRSDDCKRWKKYLSKNRILFAIPAVEALDAIRDLEMMGLSHRSLYTGVQGYAESMRLEMIVEVLSKKDEGI